MKNTPIKAWWKTAFTSCIEYWQISVWGWEIPPRLLFGVWFDPELWFIQKKTLSFLHLAVVAAAVTFCQSGFTHLTIGEEDFYFRCLEASLSFQVQVSSLSRLAFGDTWDRLRRHIPYSEISNSAASFVKCRCQISWPCTLMELQQF